MARFSSNRGPSRTAALVQGAAALVSSSVSDSTASSYNKTILEYQDFVRDLQDDLKSFPANPGQVILYATDLFQKKYAPATIASRLSALTYWHKIHSHPDPCSHFLVQKLLTGTKKSKPQIDDRQPITPPMLQSMFNVMPQLGFPFFQVTLYRAMLVLSFSAFLRPGEITKSDNNLLFSDVALFKDQFDITFSRFKHHVGNPVTISLTPSQSPPCPIAAMSAYLQLRGKHQGPLFCTPSGQPIPYREYAALFNRLQTRLGLTGKLTPHCARIGAATFAATQGVSEENLRAMGRWKSTAYRSYVRIQSFKR